MTTTERSLLLESYKIKHTTSTRGLSVAVATVCIIDVFGVFPLVTFPKAVIQCGKIHFKLPILLNTCVLAGYYGIFVVVFTISVQMYTAVLLGKCWLIAEELKPNIKTKSRCPYSALAELTWGKWMTYLTNFLLDISVFAAGIPNLIVGEILILQYVLKIVIRIIQNLVLTITLKYVLKCRYTHCNYEISSRHFYSI